MANKAQIDLHNGTGFDYLFVMRKFQIGHEIRNRLLIYHLEGLIHIISMIENDKIPGNVSILGTSYFFNERTINKLGFELEKPSLFYRFNLMANFIDLFWMHSVAKGKFSIPKIWSVKKFKVTGSKLIIKKEFIVSLHARMVSIIKAST